MSLDLYYFSLLNDDPKPWLEPAQAVLDHQELSRYHGYVERKKIEFSIGRLMAKRALAARLSVLPHELSFCYNEQGKPFLANHTCHFNISHCKSSVVVVVSDLPAGVDVEQIFRHRSAKRPQPWQNAAAFLNSQMAQHLDELAGGDETLRATLFTQFWTCLEARVKMTGDSIFTLRDHFNLRLKNTTYQLLSPTAGQDTCRFASWKLQDNEIVSLACASLASLRVWRWRGEHSYRIDARAIASTSGE